MSSGIHITNADKDNLLSLINGITKNKPPDQTI